MQRWQYLTIKRQLKTNGGLFSTVRTWTRDIPAELPTIGNEGWNLSNITSITIPEPANLAPTIEEIWIFKRPTQTQ